MQTQVDRATRRCPHGAAVARAGVGRSRRPFAGYFCPADRLDCKPAYINPDPLILPPLRHWQEDHQVQQPHTTCAPNSPQEG
jgi:hypothetical protein